MYPGGLERIQRVYRQDVLKIESKNTQGRRATGVVRTKLKDYKNEQKKSRIPTTKTSNEIQGEPSNHLPDTTEPQSKRRKTISTRHRTTEKEMEILSELKVYKDKLPDDTIASVRGCLSEVWTIKKVREWWNYHKDK